MRKFIRKIKRRILGTPPKKQSAAKPAKPKEERKLSEKTEKRVQTIMRKTGWDHETAYRNMRKATKAYGVKSKDYVKFALYRLTGEEQAAKAAKIVAKRQKEAEDKEAAIQYAMNECGWDREEALKNIKETCKRLGVSYADYKKARLARLEPDGQAHEMDRRLKARKSRKQEKADQFSDVEARTGWTKDEIKANYNAAKELIGCTWDEYWQFRMYQMTEEELKTLYIHSSQALIRRRYPHSEGLVRTLESKERTNMMFSEFITRPWCINTKVTLDEFEELFKNSSGVICKPVYGLQARDVAAFSFSEYSFEEAFNEITRFPKSVVEELVIQHDDMASLNPSSVNCLRIVSVASRTKPVTEDGKMMDIIGVSVKIGGGGSIVDNLHAGKGVVCGEDVDTGIVITDGVDWDCNVYKAHPVTGTLLRGFKVPYFEEAKQFVYTMLDKLEIEGMIGWDMAIGKDGPVLIEPNAKPDPTLISIPFAPEHTGINDRIKKYLY